MSNFLPIAPPSFSPAVPPAILPATPVARDATPPPATPPTVPPAILPPSPPTSLPIFSPFPAGLAGAETDSFACFSSFTLLTSLRVRLAPSTATGLPMFFVSPKC